MDLNISSINRFYYNLATGVLSHFWMIQSLSFLKTLIYCFFFLETVFEEFDFLTTGFIVTGFYSIGKLFLQ